MPARRKIATSGIPNLFAISSSTDGTLEESGESLLASAKAFHYHAPMRTNPLLILAALAALAAFPASGETTDWKSLNGQSIASYRTGDFDAAIATGMKAIDAATAALGPSDRNIATLASNVARMCDTALRRPEAEALYARALAIREKTLGPEHLEVASVLNNLAGVLRDEGKFAEAQPLYARALAIREKALGPDSPDVAASMSNLAATDRAMGRYDEAEPLLVRSLQIREKALGADNPEVATSLNNLAALHDARGDFDAAEPLYRLALKIRERHDPKSLETAAVLNNLGELYIAQHLPDRALTVLRRAYDIREKSLPAKHPDIMATRHDLWAVHMTRGEFALAEQFADEGQIGMTEDQRRKLAIPMASPGMSATRTK
jgi:tetratricopeptide (TPR) repeat protein